MLIMTLRWDVVDVDVGSSGLGVIKKGGLN